MRLSHVIEAVYFRPWCITAAAWGAIDRLLAAKLATSPETIAAEVRAIRKKLAETPTPGDDAPERDAKAPILTMSGTHAAIEVRGIIGRNFSFIERACEQVADVDEISLALDRAVRKGAESITLDVDSPGGTVGGVPELARKIASLNERVVRIDAVTRGQMCSAAYWLAAGCETISATQSADVGSIGCYSWFYDVSAQAAMQGVSVDVFTSGKFKGQGIPGTGLSADFKAQLQAEVNQIAGWFKDHVRAHRPNVPDSAMEGLSYAGEQAWTLGLVDDISEL